MKSGFIALLVLVAIGCLIIGFIIGRLRTKRKYSSDTQYTQGALNVDCIDPEFEPGLFLRLTVPVKDIVSRDYVKFDVNILKPNSHK